jgi:hypothetical protein
MLSALTAVSFALSFSLFMKYVDEFRNPEKAQGIVEKIRDG